MVMSCNCRSPANSDHDFSKLFDANRQASLSRLSLLSDPLVSTNLTDILSEYEISDPCLDIGCGRGQILRVLGPSSVGLDYVEENCLACARTHNAVVCADANAALPFREHAFSGIVCSHVLEHLVDPHRSLVEMKRVLVPEGYLILALPTRRSIVRLLVDDYFTDHPSHIHAFNHSSITRLLDGAGFAVCECRIDLPKSAKSRVVYTLQTMMNVCPRPFWVLSNAFWVVARPR